MNDEPHIKDKIRKTIHCQIFLLGSIFLSKDKLINSRQKGIEGIEGKDGIVEKWNSGIVEKWKNEAKKN